MDKQTKEALKQMQSEMRQEMRQEIRQIQALVSEQQHAERKPEPAPSEEAAPTAKGKAEGRADGIVHYSISRPSSGDGDAPFKTGAVSVTAAQIAKTTDEAAALLGYALSSPQKVSLLRALLGREPESAAALGITTSLSTGSLYHHLRDLMHAGLIAQAGRSQYQVTPRGQRVLLLLLALASESQQG